MKRQFMIFAMTLAIFGGAHAYADGNPNGTNDLTFQLNEGQTAHIHWHSSDLQNGPHGDNPFQLTVWNTGAGADRLEDINGLESCSGSCPDFFRFSMTDMQMPDPAKVYGKPRQITRIATGTYEVTNALFSMSSMQDGDWRIEIVVNGASLGSGNVTLP